MHRSHLKRNIERQIGVVVDCLVASGLIDLQNSTCIVQAVFNPLTSILCATDNGVNVEGSDAAGTCTGDTVLAQIVTHRVTQQALQLRRHHLAFLALAVTHLEHSSNIAAHCNTDCDPQL